MSTELAIRQPVTLSNEQLKFIANTEFIPSGLRGNIAAILACVATGRELGIGDMAALKAIHIIDGKATFSAELMVQLVRRAGHSVVGEVDDESATVTGTRADNGDTMTIKWTLAMAERAGLLNKQNWRKYPEAMLWARAASQLCRMLFADCFAGATYTPEELEDGEGRKPVSTDVQGDGLAGGAASAYSGYPGSGPGPSEDPAQPASIHHDATPAAPAAESPPPAADGVVSSGPEKPLAKGEPMWKKLNVLVAQLRGSGRLTTEQVYHAVGRPVPTVADEVRWSPLRDSLTRSEAHALIDRLEEFDRLDADAPRPVWLLVGELLSLAGDKRDAVKAAVDAKIGEKLEGGLSEADLTVWLGRQLERAREAAGAAA